MTARCRDCFDRFFEARSNFNSIICVNDYVAIYLISRMRKLDPDYLEKTYIVSFSNTLLSRLYTTPFTSLAPDMDALGCAVGDIYKLVKRSGASYRAVTIYVGYKIYQRGTTPAALMSCRTTMCPMRAAMSFSPPSMNSMRPRPTMLTPRWRACRTSRSA